MKRLIALVLLALLGFYGAWPLWTGYAIRRAIETEDAALLESKVDFASVRQSLKPVVTAEADAYVERLKRDVGPLGGLIAGSIKGDVTGRLVESAINAAITPPNVIRMVREGRSLKQSLQRVLADQAGGVASDRARLPGLGGKRDKAAAGDVAAAGKAESPQARPAEAGAAPAIGADMAGQGSTSGAAEEAGRSARQRLSLANIKTFSIDGPLAFTVGVAKDAAAEQSEVAASLRFTGGDWKVVAVTPDFDGRRANRR